MKQQIQSSVDKLKGVWSQTGRGGQGKDSGLSLGLLHLHLVQAPSLWLTPEPPTGSHHTKGAALAAPAEQLRPRRVRDQGCPSVGSDRSALCSLAWKDLISFSFFPKRERRNVSQAEKGTGTALVERLSGEP